VVGVVTTGGAIVCDGVEGAAVLGAVVDVLGAAAELAAGSSSSPSTALLMDPITRRPATTRTQGRLWKGFFAGGVACGYWAVAPDCPCGKP
jgi:hypothetical protein